MAEKKPIPGILWVNSDVIKPDQLSKEDFDSWYCDEHIPDVVAKSGIATAHRYEYVPGRSIPERSLGFLTVYLMEDVNFMETKEFKSLEGQSPGPSKERIFTRSYELVQLNEAGNAKSGPAPLLLCAPLSHSSDSEIDEWYRKEHVPFIAKTPGYRRSTRYKLATRSILSAFERSFPPGPTWLTLHEFDGPEIPWKELKSFDETDWARKIIPEIQDPDLGFFRLKAVFTKSGRDSF